MKFLSLFIGVFMLAGCAGSVGEMRSSYANDGRKVDGVTIGSLIGYEQAYVIYDHKQQAYFFYAHDYISDVTPRDREFFNSVTVESQGEKHTLVCLNDVQQGILDDYPQRGSTSHCGSLKTAAETLKAFQMMANDKATSVTVEYRFLNAAFNYEWQQRSKTFQLNEGQRMAIKAFLAVRGH